MGGFFGDLRGAGFIIQAVGYYWFFYIIGGITALIGLVCVPFLREEAETEKPKGTYWQQIASTFQFSKLETRIAISSRS